MPLGESVREFVQAGFCGIWIKSHEPDEALRDLTTMVRERNEETEEQQRHWTLCTWDLQNGLDGDERITNSPTAAKRRNGYDKPGALFNDIPDLAREGGRQVTLFVLSNFHRKELSENSLYIQSIQNLIAQGKGEEDHRYYLLFLCNTTKMPDELSKYVVVAEHELPTKEQLWTLMTQMSGDMSVPIPDDQDEQLLLQEAASGLTTYEAENAIALSMIRTKKRDDVRSIDPKIIWEVKSQSLKKRGLLELYEGDASFETMGGLGQFRDFTMKLLGHRTSNPLLYPKGLLLLGVPGSGKTKSVRCLGNATGRNVLHMRMGSLRSKYQGESDQNLDAALGIAEAMAPCILFIDEVEKALSGVGSGGMSDGGTGERMFGRLLEWQNDHRSDVFFMCTCNDISRIVASNPEFVRAGRFDGMFFFDVPTPEERRTIWEIYLNLFEHEYGAADFKTLVDLSKSWTGAEIEECARLAKILDESLEETAKSIVPVATTADSTLESLRDWASGKCRSVNRHGLYQYTKSRKGNGPKRKKGVKRRVTTT